MFIATIDIVQRAYYMLFCHKSYNVDKKKKRLKFHWTCNNQSRNAFLEMRYPYYEKWAEVVISPCFKFQDDPNKFHEQYFPILKFLNFVKIQEIENLLYEGTRLQRGWESCSVYCITRSVSMSISYILPSLDLPLLTPFWRHHFKGMLVLTDPLLSVVENFLYKFT